jgi:hypothetical protein
MAHLLVLTVSDSIVGCMHGGSTGSCAGVLGGVGEVLACAALLGSAREWRVVFFLTPDMTLHQTEGASLWGVLC